MKIYENIDANGKPAFSFSKEEAATVARLLSKATETFGDAYGLSMENVTPEQADEITGRYLLACAINGLTPDGMTAAQQLGIALMRWLDPEGHDAGKARAMEMAGKLADSLGVEMPALEEGVTRVKVKRVELVEQGVA